MARYELGAVYKINAGNEIVYYVRLLELDCYGVFAPFEGELCEDTLLKTPYRLYFCCNSFAVKRGIWEKVLPSPDAKDTARWKSPDLANYGNYNPVLFLEQHRIFHKGNPYEYDKKEFIQMVKSGLIENIFNRHEVIPPFLMNYYEGWPASYILARVNILSGTVEHQKETLEALNEMGFDVSNFTIA
ncbi:MAG: hypothetical protein LBK13_04285 [Spirochaetales bacterium]|jgi:hypothetical protein|nr:hypothetical protein [Spirochaetales bacterium]